MDKALLDCISEGNKWLNSLKHFAEVEGHHNMEVMMVVSHKIAEIEIEQQKLTKQLEVMK